METHTHTNYIEQSSNKRNRREHLKKNKRMQERTTFKVDEISFKKIFCTILLEYVRSILRNLNQFNKETNSKLELVSRDSENQNNRTEREASLWYGSRRHRHHRISVMLVIGLSHKHLEN